MVYLNERRRLLPILKDKNSSFRYNGIDAILICGISWSSGLFYVIWSWKCLAYFLLHWKLYAIAIGWLSACCLIKVSTTQWVNSSLVWINNAQKISERKLKFTARLDIWTYNRHDLILHFTSQWSSSVHTMHMRRGWKTIWLEEPASTLPFGLVACLAFSFFFYYYHD